jgi:hypothetical protein
MAALTMSFVSSRGMCFPKLIYLYHLDASMWVASEIFPQPI